MKPLAKKTPFEYERERQQIRIEFEIWKYENLNRFPPVIRKETETEKKIRL